MKVLMISGDKNMLVKGTDAYKRLQLQRAQVDELQVFVWGRESATTAREIITAARAGVFDVVTAQDPFMRGEIAFRAAKAAGAKLNLQLHTDLTAQSFIKRRLAKFLLRRANSIRVVSDNIKDSLAPLGLSAPISVLPVFIDIAAVRAAAPVNLREEYPQFVKIILVSSRLAEEKNVKEAISILPEVLKTLPDAGLFIAGQGPQKESLEALARNLGVEKNVVFLGFRSDIYSLYKGADAVLNPSWYEGYGASIVEALAAGVPVISADVGVAKEAGAVVVSRQEFAPALIKILQEGQKGVLQISVLSESEWAAAWRKTL